MIPHVCRVKHDPPDSFGDCLRTSVASLLDFEEPTDVPHFHHDGCTSVIAQQRLTDWLRSQGIAPWWQHVNGIDLNELLEYMAVINPDVHYLLFGNNRQGPHVVICCGGEIVHDTAWISSRLVGPTDGGHWSICVFATARVAR